MLCTGDILKSHMKLYFSDFLCTGNPAPSQKSYIRRLCGTLFLAREFARCLPPSTTAPCAGIPQTTQFEGQGCCPRRDQLVVSFILLARRCEYVTRRTGFGSIYQREVLAFEPLVGSKPVKSNMNV